MLSDLYVTLTLIYWLPNLMLSDLYVALTLTLIYWLPDLMLSDLYVALTLTLIYWLPNPNALWPIRSPNPDPDLLTPGLNALWPIRNPNPDLLTPWPNALWPIRIDIKESGVNKSYTGKIAKLNLLINSIFHQYFTWYFLFDQHINELLTPWTSMEAQHKIPECFS